MSIWPFSYRHALELRRKCRKEAEETGKDARDAANRLREAVLKATADTSGRQNNNDR